MKTRTIVIIVVAVVVLAMSGCCCVAFTLFGGKGDYKLSDDQKAVIEDFGQPDDFTIMFGQIASEAFDDKGEQPTHRVEYWNYRDSRVTAIFRDGKFVRQAELAPLPAGSWTYPKLNPEQFAEGMPAKDVVELIGEMPDKTIKTTPASGMKLVTVSFKGQIQASFEDGKLVMLETRPVKVAGK